MTLFNAISVSSTGMTANRLWIDLIANNISNSNTTNPQRDPYSRKIPVFAEMIKEAQPSTNIVAAQTTTFEFAPDPIEFVGSGVQVYDVRKDDSPFKFVNNPGHPHADENGFVKMPNVDVIYEMVDMIAANRAYDANVQTANSAKAMINKALEIGK